MKNIIALIPQGQSHGYWFPSDARSQAISSRSVDPVLPEYTYLILRRGKFNIN